MSQEQAVEAARTRIQRLVEEIALLAKKDLATEQFLPEFLNRVVKACDGRGGAVWLVGQRTAEGKAEFQLAAQVDFESSGFQADEVQRALMLRALTECVNQRNPIVIQPMQAQAAPGSAEADLAQLRGEPAAQPQNRTAFPFLHVPLPLKDQVLGVVQVWLQPYVSTENYREFAQFLTQLSSYVEGHFQSRRLGTLVVETQRLQHLLKYTADLAGSLDPLEVSRLAANYGRDLIGCERCSVLWLDSGRWRVLSISGQEVVEKKSTMVKAMGAFVGAHVKPEMVILSKERLLAMHGVGVEPAEGESSQLATRNGDRTDEIDLAYFDVSHVVSGVIAPMLDDEKQLIGAYFAESTADAFFDTPPNSKEQPLAVRVTDWLATHTGKALRAAHDYHSLPFLPVTRRLRATRLAFAGNKRRRTIRRLIVWGGLAAAILLFPWNDNIEGNCTLMPEQHTAVAAEIVSRIEKVLVREGSVVKRGDPLIELDPRKIETELEVARKDVQRFEAEAERLRGAVPSDEAGAQVASLTAASTRENVRRLEQELESATLRAPIDGVVMTKDVEKRTGEVIQLGTPLLEIAALDSWDLKVDVNQKDVGRLEDRLLKGPINVSYILYSQTAYTLNSKLTQARQISAAAEPREQEHVFVVTIEDVSIPANIQPSMRPGLTGRVWFELGKRPLGWLWSKRVWSWFQILLMKW
jgi:biotin carboxyl carrier protein